ncbi:MAG TPA: hypothetical protein VGA32_01020 [Anaerolineales bacterium]
MKNGIVSTPVRLALWAMSLALAAACAPAIPSPTPPSPTEPAELAQAEAVLIGYFAALASGDYANAADVYAGPITMLREYNPDVNPDDVPRLLERYCTQNGGVCLPVESFTRREAVAEDTFIFTVQFANRDATTFEIGPCCGEEDTGQRTRQFNYTVLLLYDGFKIFKLPPYVP